MNEPVFILGCSRTGSKIYMSILNDYSPINITQELHYLNTPWRNIFYRKDFVRMVKNKIGDLNDNKNVSKLIDLIYSKKLEGSFWDFIEKRNLNKYNLEKKILNSDRSFKIIFKIILEEHAEANNKKIYGAKFPVNSSYIRLLMEWFPNSKIVFLIRDPRAIFASLSGGFRKKITSKNKIFNTRILLMFSTILQFNKAVKNYKKYSQRENYFLIRFEDIITQPEKYLKRLCNFLEIEFKKEMLLPSVFDSSFKTKQNKGFDRDTLNRWKKHISPIDEKIIKFFTYRQMKELKYL
jgi:hypothetical protein